MVETMGHQQYTHIDNSIVIRTKRSISVTNMQSSVTTHIHKTARVLNWGNHHHNI